MNNNELSQSYRLTCEILCESACNIYFYAKSGNIYLQEEEIEYEPTNPSQFKELYVDFRADEPIGINEISIYPSDATIYIRRLKLVTGLNTTDWSASEADN
jgi:hypothetical protein